jgi:hypothetical protein
MQTSTLRNTTIAENSINHYINMSFSNTYPHPSPASGSTTGPSVHADPDQRRTSTDSDVIHYLYFEDNDGFFPPSWIGKESQQILSDKGKGTSDGSGGEAKRASGSEFEGKA